MPPTQDPDGDAPNRPNRNPPLVIVSERGRHSEASRRIVRAQAARASAAQSRETRARNREDRFRDSPQSPAENVSTSTSTSNAAAQPWTWNQQHYQSQQQPSQSPARPYTQASQNQQPQNQQLQNQQPQNQQPQNQQPQNQQPQNQQPQNQQPQNQQTLYQQNQNQQTQNQQPYNSNALSDETALAPLVNWITNVLQLSAASLAAGAAALASAAMPSIESAGDAIARAGNALTGSGDSTPAGERSGGLFSGKQLPVALPKGFALLQRRIRLSESFLQLLSRTACFDYGSPGVDHRLNQLLFDIVMNEAASYLPGTSEPAHPIQGHLRIACACLTIVQGQHTEGTMFAGNEKYAFGLQAAWLEVTNLDQNALREPKSPEAALWAVFIISVTCGSTVEFFAQVMREMLEEMQLRRWEEVRNVLINFIYPGSFLEAPCRQFYHQLQGGQAAG